MTKDNVQKIANLSYFNTVSYACKWKGYSVWSVSIDNDASCYTGYPQFILTRKSSWRWARDNKESIEIMNEINKTKS